MGQGYASTLSVSLAPLPRHGCEQKYWLGSIQQSASALLSLAAGRLFDLYGSARVSLLRDRTS